MYNTPRIQDSTCTTIPESKILLYSNLMPRMNITTIENQYFIEKNDITLYCAYGYYITFRTIMWILCNV